MSLQQSTLEGHLRQIGIGRGDVVHIQSDLRRIGFVQNMNTREDLLTFYYSGFRNVIGSEGTLSVNTMFLDYGRKGIPFDVKSTPSQAGAFSEYIRQMPGSIRSIHPIVSVCANGPKGKAIAAGDHFAGHSAASPWARLHKENAWIVSLGLGLRPGGSSFLHYVENQYSVPYLYTKLFDYPVSNDGQPIDGQFTLNVRYLDYRISYNTSPFRRSLAEAGLAYLAPLGNGDIFACRANVLFEEGMKSLAKDRYCFLSGQPEFVRGKIPFDGPLYNNSI